MSDAVFDPRTGVRPVRILVVDDEPLLAEMLSTGLGYEGYTVTVAGSGPDALEQARATRPDLVILAVALPGMDGLEVCRRLRRQSEVGILILTDGAAVEDRISGLESGADDCLAKPFTFRELLARARAILRRRGADLQPVLRAGDITLDRRRHRVTRGPMVIELTPLEFELLDLFISHPRQIFPREVILNRVWGFDHPGDSNLIDVHVRHLREKLGDADRTLLRSVRGIGYGLEVPDDPG